MKTISAVMSVYNEAKLLPHVLKNIEPHVDEIVIVDGSPDGPSTDNTKAIAKECPKVQYHSGTFKAIDGAWDMGLQRNTGISTAKGDLLFFLSADMLYTNLHALRAEAERDKHRIYFCPTIEFWLTTRSLRLYSADGDILSVPSNILEPMAIDRELNPYCEGDGRFNLDAASMSHRVILSQTFKYHLGWVRPFRQQVAKHIRHVRQHRWGEAGEKLLRGSERGLEQWAMLHVLSYAQIPSIDYFGTLPEEMDALVDMKYDDGADEATQDFEKRYGVSIFKLRERGA